MFYDIYLELCKRKNVSPTRAALEMGLSKATPTTWKKRGLTPQGETLNKIAAYFDVTTDYLLNSNFQKEESNIQVTDENNQPIVLDDDALELIDSLRSRPEMKMLFSVSKKATAADIIKAVRIIEALKGESEN